MTANVLPCIAADPGKNLARQPLLPRVLAWNDPHALARS
jgi:hypothetical protein